MKYILFCFLFLLFELNSNSQTMTIIDQSTRQTLPGVNIYSNQPKLSTTTNSKGVADITKFKNVDTIFISFIGYEKFATRYSELQALNFIYEMKESGISLDKVVVSASRWEEKDKEIPYRIEKISMREANFQNPQTSADLLGSGGFAYIQKSQLAGGSPVLRGFATNRVMLVVDGVRMNNAIFRTGNLQNVISIDANSLQETEILFGPGAVMYGSDAIGGVMDFHTLTAKFADTNKLLFTGSGLARYSTANKEKTGHLDFNIGSKKWAFATSFTYSDYDDLMAGTNGNDYYLRPSFQQTINGVDSTFINSDPSLQVHSGFSQINFLQKVRFKPNENWDFDYAIHYSTTSDAPRYDRLLLDANNDSILDNAEWYYGPQKWMMNRLGITNSKSNSVYDKMRLVVAKQDYEESRHDRKTGSSRIRNQTETVNAFSANLDFDKRVNEKFSLFYGAEGIFNKIGSTANRVHIETGEITPQTTRYPNGATWESYATYLNGKYKINPRVILNTGVRYTFYRIKTDFDTTQFPFPFLSAENKKGSINGSLGFAINITESWNVYINGSTGFRAPNVDDIGKVFESEPGSVVVPNVDLKPEYVYNGEIGTTKTFGNYLKLDGTFYYTFLKDALARREFTFNGQDSILFDGQMSRVQAIQNITNAYIYGLQLGVDVYFGKGFGLRTVLNVQKGEEQSSDSLIYYPLSHASPLFGSTHLTYVRKNLKADLYAIYNGKMDYENLSLNDRSDDFPFAKDASGKPFVPSWYTLNFKIAYYVNKNLSLNAGVENITDVLYRPFASGISAPGRNFIVTLRGNF
jgi:hemoglobin/transferrin/lactoferrin receptor protein